MILWHLDEDDGTINMGADYTLEDGTYRWDAPHLGLFEWPARDVDQEGCTLFTSEKAAQQEWLRLCVHRVGRAILELKRAQEAMVDAQGRLGAGP